MSKENYKNYFNGGCSTCMFAERDERGRYIGSCSGFSNCSYEEYKGETDITEEEKDKKIADLEAKLAEKDAELNRYAEFFGMKDKDFYVVEKVEYDKMKQGAKDIVNDLKQELADAEEHIDSLELQLREQYQLVDEKDEQLAEKEREIKLLNAMISTLPEHDKELEELHNQDKISFAVECLKDMNRRIDERVGNRSYGIWELFEDKCNELKKELKLGNKKQ